MAQSSALRQDLSDPAPKKITINANNDPNPKNAQIDNGGSVEFNAAKACWIYFSPVGVFDDGSGVVKLGQGNNPPIPAQQQNVTVNYCVTDPNTTCNPAPVARNVASITDAKTPLTGGNTIKVG